MGTCFIIQPFDKGKFDKRFRDVFSPAVRAAGLEPYRVDHDPSVSIPIEDIQAGIEASEACLADITLDSPNVWFELGYAIAARREVILVCSDERKSRFPFDVQHRSIITYSTESSSDFEELRNKIEAQIKARLQRREKLGQAARIQSVVKMEGLDSHEVAALVSVAEGINDPNDGLSAYRIRQAMESAGFKKIATTLGIKALLHNGMLERFEDRDYNGETFNAYRVADPGMAWLLANREKLVMKQEPPSIPGGEDIPF